MSREDFVKIFQRYPDNVVKAREMINDGYSYELIAKELRCERTSVYSFRLREEKKGYIFQDEKNKGKLYRVPRITKKTLKESKGGEVDKKVNKKNMILEDTYKINKNKIRYEDFIKENNKKLTKLRRGNLKKAKAVIKGLKKNRKKVQKVGVWG